MKAIFVAVGMFCLMLAGLLLYAEWKHSERFNWNCYLAGIMTFLGAMYVAAKPLIAGRTYRMGAEGLVEVAPVIPMQQV